MTTPSTLGPFMTLILTLTAERTHADDVINPSRAGVAKGLLFARLVIEILSLKQLGYTHTSGQVFRIGSSQECRVS